MERVTVQCHLRAVLLFIRRLIKTFLFQLVL